MRSLRVQLIVIIGVVLALGLGALLALAGSQMATMTMTAFIREKQTAAVVAASSLTTSQPPRGGPNRPQPQGGPGNPNSGSQPDPAAQALQAAFAQEVLNANAASTNTDFTYLGPNNNVIATTHTEASDLQTLPEISAAQKGTATTITRNDRLYIAIPLIRERRVMGVLWADTSLAPVQAELQTRWLTLIGAALAALVVACFAGWWLSLRISRPLSAITSVAAQMADGRLGVRAEVSNTSQEINTLEHTFNYMAQQIEAMLERQRDFVGNASHELRSPLAAIRLRAEAIASGAVAGDDAHQYAVEIDAESARLGRLVEDLLNLTQAEGASFKPPTEPINLIDELKASVGIIRPRSDAKHQQLVVNIDPNIPDVYMYSNDVRLMVGNLLDNAVKYTPDGGQISLMAAWQAKDNTLNIQVKDSGIGIPTHDLSRVSERFFRVDRAHSRTIAGTGLGLSLVTAIARSYNGKLTLHSSGIPNEGTQAELVLHPALTPAR